MRSVIIAIWLILGGGSVGMCVPSETTVLDWNTFPLNNFRQSNATLEPITGTGRVRLDVGVGTDWPGVTYQFAGGPNSGVSEDPAWNLDAFAELSVEVRNLSQGEQTLHFRVDDDARADGSRYCITRSVTLAAGETGAIRVPLRRKLAAELAEKLIGMRGNPPDFGEKDGLDLTHICGIVFFRNRPTEPAVFELGPIVASGEQPETPGPDSLESLFPIVDELGQYRHRDWPGKIHAESEFPQRIAAERADLARNPGPNHRNEFGGWTNGPEFEKTGFFHVKKVDGMWWFVDPAGRLFWSNGVDCVGTANGVTPITHREHLFTFLPGRDDPVFGRFYGTATRSPVGYYRDFDRYENYNQTESNLYRKYGPDWKSIHALLAHRRLRSWGLNTIGNWSDTGWISTMEQLDTTKLQGEFAEELLREAKRTPYVATAGGGSPPIQGSQGYWGKFPDPFHAQFRPSIDRSMRNLTATINDPYCIGYFVHNELSWGNSEFDLAEATLTSPADQPAKLAFVDELKRKYVSIGALNDVWGTDHASWDALLRSQTKPDRERAKDDLTAFTTRIAEEYFEGCRDMVKKSAPDQLYLGCRFAWGYDRATRAAAKFCDVISFNRYQNTLSEFRIPPEIDKPVIIGEFHFGALDRGMFHTGLVPTKDQDDRADHYRRYLESGLRHPNIIGAHWFQYADQATTGRFDGENYQIGFIDITDTPYPEIVKAARAVGHTMYELRAEAGGTDAGERKNRPESGL
ncbi:MAG: beta-agarase [Planctomycetia bacterium]|nr:beta-agarase [Planctomycetia bacterium]